MPFIFPQFSLSPLKTARSYENDVFLISKALYYYTLNDLHIWNLTADRLFFLHILDWFKKEIDMIIGGQN